MKSKQQVFFLTKLDLIKMMSVVEEKVPLEYILMGSFEHKTIRREISISNFEDLGYTYYSNWMSLDNRYMVIPLVESFNRQVGNRGFTSARAAHDVALIRELVRRGIDVSAVYDGKGISFAKRVVLNNNKLEIAG